MKSRLILGLLVATVISSLLVQDADAKRWRFRNRRVQAQQVQLKEWDWPWAPSDEVIVPDEPAPEPTPDPAPLPDNPDDLEPAPEPGPEPVLPEDPAELNQHIANQLGGYTRANHEKNGVQIEIYQARGRQRGVWEVASCEDWMSAVGKAAYLKKKTGANFAGLALVCDQPTPVEPLPEPTPEPQPEPAPEPQPEPTPDEPQPSPDVPPLDDSADEVIPDLPAPDEEPLPTPEPEGDEEEVLYACGGNDLLDAKEACEGAGLWLVVVRKDTGKVHQEIYNPQK